MTRKAQLILSFLMVFSLIAINASAIDWKIYASYHNHTKAVKTDSRIFVLANGALFSYDTEDETVESYDKSGGLSDFGIKDIAYSSASKTLVAVYENNNIDLLTMDGGRWNMPELKNKALSDKTLNELNVVGKEALISLNSGLAIVDISKGNFSNFYDFGSKVTNATIANGKIYVKTTDGVYEGNRTKNLQDKGNWIKTETPSVTFGQTEAEKKTAAELLDKVKNVTINSPLRNLSYKLNLLGNRLLVAGGNFYDPSADAIGTAMCYENDKWSAFEEDAAKKAVGDILYMNVTDVLQDPNDASHHWLGTKRSGIYEFKDFKFVKNYTHNNSALSSILPKNANANRYVWVTGLAYDPNGNIWMFNNECDTIIKVLKKDGKWASLYYKDLSTCTSFNNTIFDSRGWMWTNATRWSSFGGKPGVIVINTNGTLEKTSDDQYRHFYSFKNQDGTSYEPQKWNCAVEDLNGAMWIGTSEGIFVAYNPELVFNSDYYLSQVKVPRNDGTNLADYLLNQVHVRCIAIDGGNRKWVGTAGNGIYLISADGLETIEHFTADNSPLISDEINDIAINGETGEVFIATVKGLCSYQGDATDPAKSMNSSSLKVWPNPVHPDYQGKIHVSGLMFNSDVKVVSASGKVVAQGKSIGGEFSWDGHYSSGGKVASGIYYFFCTDEEGNKGACGKVLIIK